MANPICEAPARVKEVVCMPPPCLFLMSVIYGEKEKEGVQVDLSMHNIYARINKILRDFHFHSSLFHTDLILIPSSLPAQFLFFPSLT